MRSLILCAIGLLVWTIPASARGAISVGAGASGGGLSWPVAIGQAFQSLPRSGNGELGDPVLDRLKAQDFNLPRGQALLEPLIETLESSPTSLGVRSPEALARLASGTKPEEAQRLSEAMALAVKEAQDLADHRAEALMGDFKEGISASRLDYVYDSVEALLFSRWPYLSRKNSEELTRMHEVLAEARYQAKLGKVKGLVRRMGDALAQEGLPPGAFAPNAVELASIKGYSDDPRRPFPFPAAGYYSQQLSISSVQLRVLKAYQAAIDHFVYQLAEYQRGPECELEPVFFSVRDLEGDLAEGKWEHIALASFGVSYEKAKTIASGSARVSGLPTPIDLRIDFSLAPSSRVGKFVADLREKIYNTYGVLIRLNQNNYRPERVPIEEVLEGGLLRHIAVAKTVKELGKKNVISSHFEEERQNLGLADAELALLRGKWVLSVTPGFNDFGKILEEKHGALAVVMDWWYALTRSEIYRHIKVLEASADESYPVHAEDVIKKLPSRVVAGLFPKPSLPEDSFREVIFHDWLYRLLERNKEWAFEILREAIRVAEPGGNIRVRFPFTSSNEAASKRKILESFLLAEFPHFLWDMLTTDNFNNRVLVIHKPRLPGSPIEE